MRIDHGLLERQQEGLMGIIDGLPSNSKVKELLECVENLLSALLAKESDVLLDSIVAVLDGKEWDSGTAAEIAELLRGGGYVVGEATS